MCDTKCNNSNSKKVFHSLLHLFSAYGPTGGTGSYVNEANRIRNCVMDAGIIKHYTALCTIEQDLKNKIDQDVKAGMKVYYFALPIFLVSNTFLLEVFTYLRYNDIFLYEFLSRT